MDLLWNGLFCGALIASSLALPHTRKQGPMTLIVVVSRLAPVAGAWLLAPFIARDPFALLRLLSWTLFVHLPILLLLIAALYRRRRATAGALTVAAFTLVAIGYWAFRVEPERLEITRIDVEAREIGKPITVTVLADFQTDRIGAYERRVLTSLAATRADIVLLTGDVLQVEARRRASLRESFQSAWREAGIDPPLGAFAVQGNTDPSTWHRLYEGLPVTPLEDEAAISAALAAQGLELHGLSLAESFKTRSRLLPSPSARSPFRIVFGHGPDFALGLGGADLLIAGHTHGGQVQLPWIGPLITFSRVPRSWASGVTEIPYGGTLVVSRGTGLERGNAPRLRFLCRPEIVVIDLLPSS